MLFYFRAVLGKGHILKHKLKKKKKLDYALYPKCLYLTDIQNLKCEKNNFFMVSQSGCVGIISPYQKCCYDIFFFTLNKVYQNK